MTPELQRYYESRLNMMSGEAWKQLMEDVEEMLKSTNSLDGTTKDNVDFKRGEVSIMRWMLSLKDVSEQAYEQLKEDDAQVTS